MTCEYLEDLSPRSFLSPPLSLSLSLSPSFFLSFFLPLSLSLALSTPLRRNTASLCHWRELHTHTNKHRDGHTTHTHTDTHRHTHAETDTHILLTHHTHVVHTHKETHAHKHTDRNAVPKTHSAITTCRHLHQGDMIGPHCVQQAPPSQARLQRDVMGCDKMRCDFDTICKSDANQHINEQQRVRGALDDQGDGGRSTSSRH